MPFDWPEFRCSLCSIGFQRRKSQAKTIDNFYGSIVNQTKMSHQPRVSVQAFTQLLNRSREWPGSEWHCSGSVSQIVIHRSDWPICGRSIGMKCIRHGLLFKMATDSHDHLNLLVDTGFGNWFEQSIVGRRFYAALRSNDFTSPPTYSRTRTSLGFKVETSSGGSASGGK